MSNEACLKSGYKRQEKKIKLGPQISHCWEEIELMSVLLEKTYLKN